MRTYADDYGHPLNHNIAPEPEAPQDLTLGMAALLGIFFAIVLVCAVFFGFGYSTGRTLHGAKTSPVTTASLAQKAGSPGGDVALSPSARDDMNAGPLTGPSTHLATPSLAKAQPLPKPSPGAQLADTAVPSEPLSESSSPLRARASAVESPLAPTLRPRAVSRPSYAPAQSTAPLAAVTSATGGVMVQIAAVVHPADAETLAQALRKNGYNAVVRTDPADKFLHVQIGPFSTREEAKVMRALLAANGYNAFLKQ